MNDNDNANMYEIFERLNRVQSQPSKIDEAAAPKAQVNELSPNTLSSYADKARGQRNWAHGRAMAGQQGNQAADPTGKFDKLADKRAAGYNKAVAKGARDIDKTQGLQSRGGPASSWNWSKDEWPAALNRPMEDGAQIDEINVADLVASQKAKYGGKLPDKYPAAKKTASNLDVGTSKAAKVYSGKPQHKDIFGHDTKSQASGATGPRASIMQKASNWLTKEDDQGTPAALNRSMEESKPDFLDLDKDGNKKEPMKSAAKDAKKHKKDVEEGMFKDTPAKSKVPAFQRKAKGGNWKTSMQDLEHERSQSPTGRAGLEKAKRRLGQVSEGLDQIMRTMGRDIEQFKRSGELTDELYSALYDYYMDEMPYGVAKARTGDPYEWIMNKLESELGVDEGNLFTGNLAKARAAGVKKADLDGDGDMEKVNELDINLIKAAQKDAAKTVKHSDPESDRNIHKKYGHRSDRDDTGNDDDYDEFGNEKKKKSQPAAGDKRGRGRPKKYTADKPRQERVTAKSRKADRTAYTKKKVGEEELSEKSVSKAQQRFMGMAHAMQKGEKVPGASKELKKVAKTMGKGDVKDFAKTKHKGLPEKKKKTDEMTTSGGVAPSMAPMGVRQTKEEMTDVLRAEKGGVKGATQPPADSQFAPGDKRNSTPAPSSTSAPKAVKETDKVPTNKPKEKTGSGSMQFGKGIYDSFNRKLEGMIAEGMQINASMNTDAQGGPSKTLTITATDESAEQLMMLLKMAGLTQESDACPHCGQSPCGCDHVEEDLANSPDEVTASSEVVTQGMSGGLNKPKSTGQTTVPVMNVDPKRQGMLETMQRQLWKKYQG